MKLRVCFHMVYSFPQMPLELGDLAQFKSYRNICFSLGKEWMMLPVMKKTLEYLCFGRFWTQYLTTFRYCFCCVSFPVKLDIVHVTKAQWWLENSNFVQLYIYCVTKVFPFSCWNWTFWPLKCLFSAIIFGSSCVILLNLVAVFNQTCSLFWE